MDPQNSNREEEHDAHLQQEQEQEQHTSSGMPPELQHLHPIHITEEHFYRLLQYPYKINVGVYPTGFDKYRSHRFVDRAMLSVARAKSMQDALYRTDELRERFNETGLFSSVDTTFEPASEGGNNVIVRVGVKESRGRREFGVSTDTSGTPEIKLSWASLFHRPYTAVLEVLPTNLNRSASAATAKIQSYDPWFGRIAEYGVTQSNVSHVAVHSADVESRAEANVTVHAGRPTFRHSFSFLATHSSLRSTSHEGTIPREILKVCGTSRLRNAVRYELHQSALEGHTDPYLQRGYAHAVRGHDFRLKVAKYGGAALGGDAEGVSAEVFAAKHFLLHPLLTLGVWGRVGGCLPGTPGGDVHLLDRVFMNGQTVRGYRYVGPYDARGVPESLHDIRNSGAKGGAGARVVDQLGGRFMAALSTSLSFPVLPSVFQGIFAGHVFYNAGVVSTEHTVERAMSTTPWCHSVGAGLVLNQLPVVGAIPFGRIEFNLSLPLVKKSTTASGGDGGAVSVPGTCWEVLTRPNPRIFDRVKFGINWIADF
eukprot:PhM_4_TR14675/c0_g1_i1/m.2287